MTWLCKLKVKVTIQGHLINPSIGVRSISPELWIIFIKLHPNIPLSETVCRTYDSRSRSQFKVMGYTLEFRVHYISPEPFQLFFIKLHLNVPLSETVCRAHDSAIQTQGGARTSGLWDFALNSMSTPYLLNPFEQFWSNFTQMFLSVRRFAESMIRLRRLKVPLQVHGIYISVSCLLLICWTLWTIKFSLNCTHIFLSVRRCAESMIRLRRLKVPLQVHGIYILVSCLLLICWTLWTIFIKLHPNFPLIETVCRTLNSSM